MALGFGVQGFGVAGFTAGGSVHGSVLLLFWAQGFYPGLYCSGGQGLDLRGLNMSAHFELEGLNRRPRVL